MAAGAAVVAPPTDQPYGERQYIAIDPEGRRWTYSESSADVDPADWGGELASPTQGGSPLDGTSDRLPPPISGA